MGASNPASFLHPQNLKLTVFTPSSSFVPELCVIVTAVPTWPCQVTLAVEIVSGCTLEQHPLNPTAMRASSGVIFWKREHLTFVAPRPTLSQKARQGWGTRFCSAGLSL